jgi:hypothetical protein
MSTLEQYINYKRTDNLRSGLTEEQSEGNIQAYLAWRERYQEWLGFSSEERTKICHGCGRLTRTKTPYGYYCRECFITMRICSYPGCTKPTMHPRYARCRNHEDKDGTRTAKEG